MVVWPAGQSTPLRREVYVVRPVTISEVTRSFPEDCITCCSSAGTGSVCQVQVE